MLLKANRIIDIHPNNILAGVEDVSVLTILERDELSSPSPRKQDGDRIIYLSRPMFLTDGEPLLSDLGEARLGQSHKGTIMPSLYRAPEVILGLDWNNKVDIWGFGQTVIQPIPAIRRFANFFFFKSDMDDIPRFTRISEREHGGA